MEELATNLKRLINEKGITSKHLAQEIKQDPALISRLIQSRAKGVKVEVLIPIAHFFGITIDELIGVTRRTLPENCEYGMVISLRRRVVPILRWDHLEFWGQIKENYRPEETTHTEADCSPNIFALRIADARYKPLMSPGNIIIVDPDYEYKDRNFLVVKYNREIVIAQVFETHDAMAIKVVSTNDIQKVAKNNIKIYGTIIENRME